MGSYVGIDVHRRRSVVVVLNADGDRVSWCRIDNTPANLAGEIVAAGGAAAEVAMEATWGWYWAADVIQLRTRRSGRGGRRSSTRASMR
jgi:hypothetical protein